MNNEEYVTYEQAEALKECGFAWPCQHYYTKLDGDDEIMPASAGGEPMNWNDGRSCEPDFLKTLCSAPTQAMAQKWLRAVKEINVYAIHDIYPYNKWHYYIDMYNYIINSCSAYYTYDEALSAGITASLELIKSKKFCNGGE